MVLELVRLGLGVADIAAPRAVARVELGRRPDALSRWALQVLGARQLLQSVLTLRSASTAAHRVGGLVDLLHAASMIVLAVADPRRRRGALVQAGLATGLGIAELTGRRS